MLRRHRNRCNQLERIIDRDLRRLLQRMVVVALVNVVIANDIGNEDAVEDAAFQRGSELRPIFQILVLPRTVARMRPQARRLVADTVHIESIEANLPRHH
jgi:hypothetical protein